jgi:outer membrane protein assembly factor BamB
MNRRLRRFARPGMIAALTVVLAGCASDQKDRSSGDGSSIGAPAPSGQYASRAEEVEAKYIIGPAASRKLNYRIDWQYPTSGRPVKTFSIIADSVFTLDDENFLTRIRREEGDRVWRIPVGGVNEEFFGVSYVPESSKVYVVGGGDILVLESATGSQSGKQKLNRIANTAPIRYGGFFIYGSRDGMVTWHAHSIGSMWRSYQVAHSVTLQPVYSDGHLAVVGDDGVVMSLVADAASKVWSKRMLDRVVARPAAGAGVVYVAGLDQYIRAFDMRSDRTPLWEYLTESPLTDSPTLIGDRVYQQVRDEGLLCMEALPYDSPGGVEIWRCAEATGVVVSSAGDNLLVWDADRKLLQIVDDRLGAVIESVNLPQVESLTATNVVKGDLYATSPDGRIIRLVPRN